MQNDNKTLGFYLTGPHDIPPALTYSRLYVRYVSRNHQGANSCTCALDCQSSSSRYKWNRSSSPQEITGNLFLMLLIVCSISDRSMTLHSHQSHKLHWNALIATNSDNHRHVLNSGSKAAANSIWPPAGTKEPKTEVPKAQSMYSCINICSASLTSL